MRDLEDDFKEEKEEYFNFKNIVMKYWPYKNVFLAFCCAFLLLGILYSLIATPTYKVKASITISDAQRGGASNDVFTAERLFYSEESWLNTENEIEVLKSSSLIEQAVRNLKLYASYSIPGFIGEKPIKGNIPIQAEMTPEQLTKMDSPINITIGIKNEKEILVNVSTYTNGEEWEKEFKYPKIPDFIETPQGTVHLNGSVDSLKSLENEMSIVLSSPIECANTIADELTVELVSRTSSVVNMEYNSLDRKAGIAFLEELIKCYNHNANEDKNRVANQTATFLKGRLSVIDKELELTDKQLEAFKQESGLTDIDLDKKEYLQENSRYGKELLDVETELNLLQHLKSFVLRDENRGAIIPTDIGLKDVTLSKTIENYNNLVLNYQKLERISSESNPVTINLKSQINSAYESVITSLENAYSGTLITKKEIEKKAQTFNSKINQIPLNERALTDIARQQETKSRLYMNLLEKMEENSFMLEAVTENAQFIDAPYSKNKPSSPNKKLVILISIVMGGFVGLIWIMCKETFTAKILNDSKIKELFGQASIKGKIPFSKKGNKECIEIDKLRQQTKLTLNKLGNCRSVCFISNNEGDGKTFISSSIAEGFAKTWKKTLLVKFKVTSAIEPSHSNWQIIPDDTLTNLFTCEVASDVNGLKLMVNSQELISFIKSNNQKFDLILIDTVSMEIIPDVLDIVNAVDYSYFICRIGNTDKVALNEISLLNKSNLIRHTGIIINNG